MKSSKGLPKWDKKKKHRGKWWPAGSPTTSYSGAIRFVDGRPRLTVKAPPVGQSVYDLHGAPVIHGELESGNKVTLWDQYEQPLLHDPTARGTRFHRHFSYALMGQHLGTYEEELFQYSAVQLHGLAEWTEMHEPTMEGLPGDELPQYPSATLQIPNPDNPVQSYTVLVRVENPKRLEISNRSGIHAFIDHMGDKARISFQCDPPAPARVHDLLLFDLQPLLSFAYHSAVSVDREWLAVNDLLDSMPVMRPHRIRREYVEQSLFNTNMVLPLSAVDPSVLFPAWWRVQEELYPAPQIITSYLQGTRGVLEGSASSVIAAAEHLHSKIGPTKERFDKKELRTKKRAVIRALGAGQDPDFIKFVGELFGNNRPTLATRLSELIDAVTPERLEIMSINGESWAADVKQVRNLLAHTGSHVPRRSNAASELLTRVNNETRAIVSILILKQMNVEATVLDQAAHALHVHLKQISPTQ